MLFRVVYILLLVFSESLESSVALCFSSTGYRSKIKSLAS